MGVGDKRKIGMQMYLISDQVQEETMIQPKLPNQ